MHQTWDTNHIFVLCSRLYILPAHQSLSLFGYHYDKIVCVHAHVYEKKREREEEGAYSHDFY